MKTISLRNLKLLEINFIVYSLSILSLLCLSSNTFGQKDQIYSSENNSLKITEKVITTESALNDISYDGKFENARGQGRGRKDPTPTPTPEPSGNRQWEIAATDGLKIYTNKNAWYYVSSEQLENFGFDTNSDQSKWQLFCDGVEIPIVVNTDNSIEFYGTGTDTSATDSKVYYLINGTADGLRIPEIDSGSGGQNSQAENFPVSVEFKERLNYLSKLLNGENENWFGGLINFNPTTVIINSDNLSTSGQAELMVKMQGLTEIDHLINFKINDYDLGTISFANKENYSYSFNVPLSHLNSGENLVSIQSIGAGNDLSLIDSIKLTFPRNYQAFENTLAFGVAGGKTARVGGFTLDNIRVYEIRDGQIIGKVSVNNEIIDGTFGFNLSASNNNREFIAVTDPSGLTPLKIEPNFPSNWNKSNNQADFIIISPANLSNQVAALEMHRESQNIKTEIVLAEDIADEFGFGILTSEAIRDFLELATTTWDQKPQYVLLFGDSSFDTKNYLGGENRNIIPTKLIETFDMETSSDGWLVDFDNDGIEDIAIGRLPVANDSEATKAINKIIRYETENLNFPKSAVLNSDYLFETLNGALEDLLPGNVSSRKIERSILGDALMRQEIMEYTNANPTFVSYLGHGTIGVWSTGNVFGIAETDYLTNEKLSFYMLMTCLNGYTHNAYSSSLAESLVLADNGAIAVWASSGSTYASGQIEMGQEVVRHVFASKKNVKRIGEAVRLSKHFSSDPDARRTWQLIGDPTLYIE